MGEVVKQIVNSLIQIVAFSVIPFIWWANTARNECDFLVWLGFKGIPKERRTKTAVWIIVITTAFLLLSVFILYFLRDINTASSEFSGMGIKAIPAILIYAILRTAIPEEILFRGFLLKRVANRFGFVAGNIVQALLFGLLHGVMFFSSVGVLKAIIIIVFTGVVGWLMGYVNEKIADGSILPGLIIHAFANIFTGIYTAFF